MKKILSLLSLLCIFQVPAVPVFAQASKSAVDYVNPYMGNISHLLVPTFPTIHLPNSMLRVYPERGDFTSDEIKGLPLVVTSHRGRSAFNLSPLHSDGKKVLQNVYRYSYDQEVIKPYYYAVSLLDEEVDVNFAPSHQSALYKLQFNKKGEKSVVFNTSSGRVAVHKNSISASQQLENNTVVYVYGEFDKSPIKAGIIANQAIDAGKREAAGKQVGAAFVFPAATDQLKFRYGISFISIAQAKQNLEREIKDYDVEKLAATGRAVWDSTLSTIAVETPVEADKALFYTSLYRCFERPVNISEDGRYFSAFDGKVHEDNLPFYTDDWIWDTYRATHPLRLLIDEPVESAILNSFVRMSTQMDRFWMPTFPEITGDSRRMNSNHGVVTIADAYVKGLRTFDIEKAYESGKKAVQEKTLAPWSSAPAGWLDDFYKEKGYIPALQVGEAETVPEVHSFERRQPVAVTLGTSYDEWALGQLATALNKSADAHLFLKHATNYRNIYNKNTGFFHPKDKDGRFIEPFDYRYAGGQGAREYYGENNGWVYRWDVPHNVADLIALMGGDDLFIKNLNQTFREPLGKSKFDFYSQLPDHTGNVGQFSMANEPSLHVPYLYTYAGQPWMTQKRIHDLMTQWFRNDLMGIPGDEDGGGMSAFVVFSMIGFYPVTPGLPAYTIGSPFFADASVKLSNGHTFRVKAENFAKENKYIQSASLNGKALDASWLRHEDVMNGGVLLLKMGDKPNRNWGANNPPPSFQMK
ncbi:GH92 family glycosyl hydrolase [Sphingobacterium oryzagri]|uniref:GH92 family glycosyl hydrolase n=1 Tax=Sphingobacterium oryzagri TaxID=3025669 RepID=A0ABY7WE47_9SPHI|nr:GH92 family glycosyl hydrolase [Sphingobacterium sp. KACC 22765]WDF67478.1 GH92 family glycosyl hydrolase [Sphingobacterium sp. KACC 22765]